jgi:NAD(P)H-flavin reductase
VGDFAAILNEAESRETRRLYERFTREVMQGRVGYVPAGGAFDDLQPTALRDDLIAGKIKAVLVTGDYLAPELLCALECLVVADYLPSAASEAATVLFPAAVLAEVSGTYRDRDGNLKYLTPAAQPFGGSRPEWQLVSELATAMGAPGFEFKTAGDIGPLIKDDPTPQAFAGDPRDDLAFLPGRYRGHFIAESVCALEAIGLPVGPKEPEPESLSGGFEIVAKREVTPNFHLLTIKAPTVARYAQPGQFVIVMAKETSERVPFTLADWDAEAGTFTMVVEEVGRSSREVAELQAGGRVAHVTGPLGLPFEIKNYGTVALGGGCYGIAAIHPLARALQAAGNRVIVVIEAASDYLVYMEDELKLVSDEVLIATKDGSRGTHGGVQEVFAAVKARERVDAFVAVGCTFMMMAVADATRDFGVPLFVALNPIMVDGTGMCGACRLSVAGRTKFACVDGPIFNGHEVDWLELMSRRGAYANVEIQALPQSARAARPEAAHAGTCAVRGD